MDALPATIGRYEVKAFIARGGMGTLYLASDPVLQRQVAIKVLREADNEELRTRFTREARSAANLRHRNIVTIFDVGDHHGQPFMAMEYIHGQTLSALIRNDPPPSTIRRLQLLEDLCEGLAFAHKRGVIHRDIKPANLMVDPEGTLKILDFGIARAAAESGMTQAGLLVGSLNYMSPQQVAGTEIDGRSDMFAVGAVMYEILTRRQAFPGAIDAGVLNKILTGEPEPLETLCPHLDPAIGQIVRRALQKDPAQRFTDLQQMRGEIAQARRALEASTAADVDNTIATVPNQDTTRVTPSVSRRGTDREDIARRRSQQIDEHVSGAREALANGQFDAAIARCEQALLIDPNESRALDIAERARLQRDEAGAKEWLERAQQMLKAGELTGASSCVREALALTPESSDAVELGRIIAETRLAQERERQRAAAIDAMLGRGRAALEAGELEATIVAADEVLALSPGHEDAQRIKARGQEAIAARARAARDAEAQQTADEARQLFSEGHHADALALLEQFWPAHPKVSHLWTELSADAARLARDEPDATVFSPRPGAVEDGVTGADDLLAAAPAADRTIATPPTHAPVPPPRQTKAPVPAPVRKTSGPQAAAVGWDPPASIRSSLPVYLAVSALLLLLAIGAYFALRSNGPGDAANVDLTARNDSVAPVQPAGDAPAIGVPSEPPAAPPGTPQTPPAIGGRASSGSSASDGNAPTVAPSGRGRGSESAAGGREGRPTTPVAPPPASGATRKEELRPAPRTEPPSPVPAPAPTPPPPVVEPPPAPVIPPAVTRPAENPEPAPPPLPSANPVREAPRDAPPPPPQVSDRDLIAAVLQRYAQAYGRLDAAAVSVLHPTIDRARVETDFRALDRQVVEILDPQIDVKGTTATVSCTVHTRVEPKAGRAQDSRVRTQFQLQKRGSTWVIVSRK